MNSRRNTLWILSFLLGGSLIFFFAIQPGVIQNLQNQEGTYQAMRQEKWTTFLQEFNSNSEGTFGARDGDVAIDTSGRVWVARGGPAGNCATSALL